MLVVGPNRLFLALHRAGAAVARRGRRRAGRAGRPRRTSVERPGADDAGSPPGSRATLRMAERPGQGGARPRAAAARGPASSASACQTCALTVAEQSAASSRDARRRFRTPQRRPPLRRGARCSRRSAASSRDDARAPTTVRDRAARTPEVREALERMWPVLTPAAAAPRPVRLAGAAAPGRRRAGSTDDELDVAVPAPRRRRSTTCVWTARRRAAARRGPGAARARRPQAGARAATTTRSAPTATSSSTRCRTSRRCSCACSTRRSLNGSMTVVGDIAQATGAWAHADWDEILAPPARPPRRARGAELTVGYRIPAPNMALAARVLRGGGARPARRRARCARTATRRAIAPGRRADGLGAGRRRAPCATSSTRSAPATSP